MKITEFRAIRRALARGAEGTLYLPQRYARSEDLLRAARQHRKKISIIHLSNTSRAQAFFVLRSQSTPSRDNAVLENWILKQRDKRLCLLVLDHIHDPQNFGAIFRSAALLGVEGIIYPTRRMAPENEVAYRAASGAFHVLPSYRVSNISRTIRMLKKNDIWIYALHMRGTNIQEYTLPHRIAFVLGNEHKGIAPSVAKLCDDLLSIPTSQIDYLDSLNVSVSAAIACYEYKRQSTLSPMRSPETGSKNSTIPLSFASE